MLLFQEKLGFDQNPRISVFLPAYRWEHPHEHLLKYVLSTISLQLIITYAMC